MTRILLFSLILAIFNPISAQNLQRIGHLSYGPLSLAGCWHHVDAAGTEWALVGTSAGLSLVDLSNPTQPVERFMVPGLSNNWREVRTWQGYAYVTTEADSSGVTIVNLNHLPDSIPWKTWRGDGFFVNRVLRNHAVQVHDGYLYLFGGSNIANGAVIADLIDPWNPKIRSKYAATYVHDGFVRGDTMWTCELNAAQFGVIDISNKTNPVLLATHPTPGGFNHNCELSADGRTLFHTQEALNLPMTAYDVSNLDDITLLDSYKPSRKPEGEVHNVRMMPGDFVVCPSYRGQLTIVDASQPDNMIEIAWDSLGNSLVWDADPYLPSGILLATAKQEGLYIYEVTYTPAARLEGVLRDAVTGLPISEAKVFVLNTFLADSTGFNGVYKTGAANSGLYAIRAERVGYQTQVKTGVNLVSGQTTQLDFALVPESVSTSEALLGDAPKVSPSPFLDVLQVDFPESLRGEYGLRLLDFSGKTVQEKQGESSNFILFEGLQNLPKGPYLLQIMGKNGLNYTFQVLKGG